MGWKVAKSLPKRKKKGRKDIEPTGKMLPGWFVIHLILRFVFADRLCPLVNLPSTRMRLHLQRPCVKKGHINYSRHMLSASCNKVTIIISFFLCRCVLDCRRCQTRRVLCDGFPRGVVVVAAVVGGGLVRGGRQFFFPPSS